MHHHHDHHGHHHHAPTEFGRAFGWGIGLNLLFVAAEVAGGLWANSSALLSDAGHNLSDVLSLALAWGATWLARRQPTERYTYGYKSATIQAALLNAALLYLALGAILWDAVDHLRHPTPVNGPVVMVLAGLGVLINGFTAWLFRRGQDVNVRGAYLHLLTDMLVSVGVVVGGAVVYFTGWHWLDPALSFVILTVVAVGSWGLLRETVQLSLQAAPAAIDVAAVRQFLLSRPGVTDLHDLHIWPLSTQDTALTVHLVRPGLSNGNQFLRDLQHDLHHEFNISHCTVQLEDEFPLMGAHGCCA
ncbi:cation diffusion facilitator family transporter [Hymenobacter weizhouensis]|uniref:cation diffusion facilitator family transporter n=1 Tax=Hymenobacter sp. YIM 151500-1 TaxID=2987689 RepID=UPI002226F1A5|nr:cation diffusion facilitator family transporter [Hymenobacter sp. YIM 151500-1]UYZ61937.1 cation diffusion facilitator family transporter [Hymenobacter sp. YIM 151500-1]